MGCGLLDLWTTWIWKAETWATRRVSRHRSRRLGLRHLRRRVRNTQTRTSGSQTIFFTQLTTHRLANALYLNDLKGEPSLFQEPTCASLPALSSAASGQAKSNPQQRTSTTASGTSTGSGTGATASIARTSKRLTCVRLAQGLE